MKASLSVLLVGLSLLFGVTLMAGSVEAFSGSQLSCGWTGQQTCAFSIELQDRAADKAAAVGFRALTNVARDRPVFCSSIQDTCTLCRYATDGDPATRWSSQFSDPQWIFVDLGAPTRIERVTLRWEAAYGQAYQVQTSQDAITWTDIYSMTAGDGEVDDLIVSGTGRYVRVYGTARGREWGYSLWELEVYGRSAMTYLPLVLRGFLPPAVTPTPTPSPIGETWPISILVDDFSPQPQQGEAVYPFNRLEGDRSAVNNSVMTWGRGQVTTTIAAGTTWGGGWLSLNHPRREGLPINFSAILPARIQPPYQSQITGITARIAAGTPGTAFRLELKDHGAFRWTHEIVLTGGAQDVSSDLPALGEINELVWVLDRAAPGDFVVLDSIAFTATTRIVDTATAAFTWSYGQLLNNWNPVTGVVRDQARDVSGKFDAVQATGSLAAATAQAEQLGIVSRADAIQIVRTISDTLLLDLTRFHGLWPHWTSTAPDGTPEIFWGTEWSSIDTAIAAVGLLTAQQALGLDTAGTEQLLRAIDWEDLTKPDGLISMGYDYDGARLAGTWNIFGGESWLVQLAYAGATGNVALMTYPSPPTANGSGFIDELAWLFVPPPAGLDYWGTDWAAYRRAAAARHIHYYPSNYPQSCFAQLGLFGLSAAEVPDPSSVPPSCIYQAFGVGGRDPCANDGAELLGAPAVVPHDAGLIASLRPAEATAMWAWLMTSGFLSPLNNVESLMFPADAGCDPSEAVWNHLKGSWNLSLQTLGWGRYLAERRGQVSVLWQALTENAFLRNGYRLLASDGQISAPAQP